MRCRHGLLCAKHSGTLPLRVTKESFPLYTVGVLDRTGAAALPVGREPCGLAACMDPTGEDETYFYFEKCIQNENDMHMDILSE